MHEELTYNSHRRPISHSTKRATILQKTSYPSTISVLARMPLLEPLQISNWHQLDRPFGLVLLLYDKLLLRNGIWIACASQKDVVDEIVTAEWDHSVNTQSDHYVMIRLSVWCGAIGAILA